MKEVDLLLAISPIDGRYHGITEEINEYFSEYAFIKYRVIIEFDWLSFLIKKINKEEVSFKKIIDNFHINDVRRIKEIEEKTNHDVKAIEYYVREKLKENNLEKYTNFVHFGCTSEDINNIAYGKMIKDFMNNTLNNDMWRLIYTVKMEAIKLSNLPMLVHTHGQHATPTTVRKRTCSICI